MYLPIKTTDGKVLQMWVYKEDNTSSRAIETFGIDIDDHLWSDLVWMYYKKQQKDGEGIPAKMLNVVEWGEGRNGALLDEYLRMRKVMSQA